MIDIEKGVGVELALLVPPVVCKNGRVVINTMCEYTSRAVLYEYAVYTVP